MLWNFEALLAKTFPGHRTIFVEDRDPRAGWDEFNFSCVGLRCNPHARYAVFSFTYREPKGTAFHISKKGLRGRFAGNWARIIRINGRAVACNQAETRFLVAYLDSFKRDLACEGIP